MAEQPSGFRKIGVQAKPQHRVVSGGRLDFIDLRVENPYLSMKINMTAVDAGKTTDMLCDLDLKRPFEGMATAELKGLPPFSSTTKVSSFQYFSNQFPDNEDLESGLTKNLFVS